MRHDIDYSPSYSLLTLHLDRGEAVRAEAGAMVSYGPGVDIETQARGGLLGSLKRSVLGGESFFLNTFSAQESTELTLAPPLPGDVVAHELAGEPLFVQSGSYLAGDEDIEMDTEFGGGRTFFGGEGLFLLRLEGHGQAYLSSYGAVHERDLAAGEEYTVDTGHIVAFEGSTGFEVERVGGLKSTLFSGEGLVCTFTGPGRIWLQTRSEDALLSWLVPKLPSNE